MASLSLIKPLTQSPQQIGRDPRISVHFVCLQERGTVACV